MGLMIVCRNVQLRKSPKHDGSLFLRLCLHSLWACTGSVSLHNRLRPSEDHHPHSLRLLLAPQSPVLLCVVADSDSVLSRGGDWPGVFCPVPRDVPLSDLLAAGQG